MHEAPETWAKKQKKKKKKSKTQMYTQNKSLLCNFINYSFFLFPSANNCLAHNLARWASICKTFGDPNLSTLYPYLRPPPPKKQKKALKGRENW